VIRLTRIVHLALPDHAEVGGLLALMLLTEARRPARTDARGEDTDWREILGLYGLLERMTDNPIVSLNRAVATAMVDGPAAGLNERRTGG
jgi:predicted RNA polymerase sigma factor